MKFFFDTSVLLPCFLEEHEHHEASLSAFSKPMKGKAVAERIALPNYMRRRLDYPENNV